MRLLSRARLRKALAWARLVEAAGLGKAMRVLSGAKLG